MKPHFHYVTLFPETIEVWLKSSILGKAYAKGLFSYSLHQLRNYAHDKHKTVDDVSYGGGGGMVFKIEPLVEAIEAIQKAAPKKTKTFYFSPAGKKINQSLVEDLSNAFSDFEYIFVCGHYEGVDQRFVDDWVDMEISLGDFVLSGGELAAVALSDALIRQIPGTLGNDQGVLFESFNIRNAAGDRLLEYPQYTRPSDFRGKKVPKILLQGNHEKISQWRKLKAEERTRSIACIDNNTGKKHTSP